MEETGISPQTKRNLELLSQEKWLGQFYLAGGTACGLYFGHRVSFDLDFFSGQSFDSQKIISGLKKSGEIATTTVAEDTFLGELNGVKISFFQYKYPHVGVFGEYLGVKLASLQDLAAMKIDALQSRGTKRDFIDLYTILTRQSWTVEFALNVFKKKFSSANYNLEHIVMSLIYFDDAENVSETLKLNENINWQEVKRFFVEQVKAYEKKILE